MIPVLITTVVSGATYLISLVVISNQLAGMPLPMALIEAAPYAALIILGLVFQKRPAQGWIVFGGAIVCAVFAYDRIHAAFFSVHPHDPWIVIGLPFLQFGLAAVVALLAAISWFISKRAKKSAAS